MLSNVANYLGRDKKVCFIVNYFKIFFKRDSLPSKRLKLAAVIMLEEYSVILTTSFYDV